MQKAPQQALSQWYKGLEPINLSSIKELQNAQSNRKS